MLTIFWSILAFFQDFIYFFKVNVLISRSFNQYKGIFIWKRNRKKRIFNLGHFFCQFWPFFAYFRPFFKILLHFSGKWINKLNLQGFLILAIFGQFCPFFKMLITFGKWINEQNIPSAPSISITKGNWIF